MLLVIHLASPPGWKVKLDSILKFFATSELSLVVIGLYLALDDPFNQIYYPWGSCDGVLSEGYSFSFPPHATFILKT